MNDEYLKMVLALPDEFFDGREWNDGDQVYLTEDIDDYDSSDYHGLYTVFDGLLAHSGINDTENWLNVRAINFKNGRPLPSQEQLQNMILNYYSKNGLDIKDRENLYLLWRFQEWLRDQTFDECAGLTIKELLLLFLMYVIYNKRWDGEKWL